MGPKCRNTSHTHRTTIHDPPSPSPKKLLPTIPPFHPSTPGTPPQHPPALTRLPHPSPNCSNNRTTVLSRDADPGLPPLSIQLKKIDGNACSVLPQELGQSGCEVEVGC